LAGIKAKKIMENLNSQYEPKDTEEKIYAFWMKNGFFNPDKVKPRFKKSFSIVLPPPNITGSLHIGHALNAVIQDILVRYHRMNGFKTVWLPGTDHGGISAESVVGKKLHKEGINKFELGREKFIEKVWEWREEYGNIILNQLKKIGASCDWSRTGFTMDQDYIKAIDKAFIHFHEKGWVYRAERVVNWCPRCKTSLSDLELEHAEEKTSLWFIKYPLLGVDNIYLTVATTRPETMLGDAAVAVNPKDARYKDLVGKNLALPVANRVIPVVADNLVDLEFGTGAVKVTPAHDLTDAEIGYHHHLPVIKVIDGNARLAGDIPEVYRGLKTAEARQKIVEELTEAGLIEKIEPYVHQVPKCYRCNSTIELIPSKQWFVSMAQLSKTAIKAVTSKKVKFHPKRWEKVFFDWQRNTRDWCVSRQLWWGERLPVWFCEKDENLYVVSKSGPKKCPFCKECAMVRSTDVFDTWFSSALWPIAAFGWPKAAKDLKTFFPTSVLSTARDIINLWVARMIFCSLELTGKVPFSDVIIHATVLTKDGKRMSKSLGTGIDPLLLIDKYGADGMRFGLAWQITESQDMHFAEDNMVAGKKFCNKLWNASRFTLMQLEGGKAKEYSINAVPPAPDKDARLILKQLKKIEKSVSKNIEAYRFGAAAKELYEFFWHDFCDTYIEKAKAVIRDAKTPAEADGQRAVLIYVLANSLKLLHPFIPFITEEIWRIIPVKSKLPLIVESWPKI
jgi:valyl-tRNA synthetase